MSCIHLPKAFVLYPNNPKGKMNFDGVHAFIIFLHIFHSPPQRVALLEEIYNYNYTTLYVVFKTVGEWMDETHGSRLHDNLKFAAPRFAKFNEAMVHSMTRGNTLECPTRLEDIALLTDGTRLRIAKPSVSYTLLPYIVCVIN